MEGDHTRLWVPGHRDRGDISTSEEERAALNISSGVSEFPEVTQRPEHRQWKQCKDCLLYTSDAADDWLVV